MYCVLTLIIYNKIFKNVLTSSELAEIIEFESSFLNKST